MRPIVSAIALHVGAALTTSTVTAAVVLPPSLSVTGDVELVGAGVVGVGEVGHEAGAVDLDLSVAGGRDRIEVEPGFAGVVADQRRGDRGSAVDVVEHQRVARRRRRGRGRQLRRS